MKSFRIRSFSGQQFPAEISRDKEYLSAFSPNVRKYGPVKLEYGYFLHSESCKITLSLELKKINKQSKINC